MGGGRIGGALRAARTTAVTSAAGLGRPRRWAAGLAWGLWALAMLGLALNWWQDRLLRQAGRPDLAVWVPGSIVGPLLAVLGAATVGAVVARRPPRRRDGGPVLPGHRRSGARPAQLGAVVDPDRVAAICPLALVGLDHRGHPPGPGAGGGGGAGTGGPAAAAGQQSLERPRSGRCPAGRHPGRPGRHRPGRGRRRRIPGGALPPRPRGRTPAAGVGGVGGGPDGAGGADCPGPGGAGEPNLGRLGVRGLGGGAAGGGGGGGPAL